MLRVFFSTVGQACETFSRAEDALAHLATVPCDIMLTDIIMPGMKGLELAERAKRLRPDMNIIVMTGHIDKFSYDDAIAAGASDFIRKPFSLNELRMRIRHVQLQEKLRVMSITDDLTGLPNQRGFFALAEQQLKAATRGKRDLALLFIDLDNFKAINDAWGHQEGDRALVSMTKIFRQSFREADIIARMSGDEFAVLLIDTPRQSIEMILDRLMRNMEQYNEQKKNGYRLSISIGTSVYDHEQPRSIDTMLKDADEQMYNHKLKKKSENYRP
jgi:diguanylate cyclase (GGDEF)-like protein